MSKEDKLVYRARLQKAYHIPDYRDAKAELLSIKDDLEASNQLKAMKSLEEGMEDTLTIQRLAIAKELGQSLRTTNCIENLNSTLGRLTRNVCSWNNSAQVHRWMALTLMYAEPKPHPVWRQRDHSDMRLARRARTIANLTRVISERKVKVGIRRTLWAQARRLDRLAEKKLKEFNGR